MNNKIKANKAVAIREGNALVKSAHLNRSDALKQGYKVARLMAIFATGATATITFTKADGSIREALALPARVGENLINGRGTATTPKANMLFVDAELGEFRSLVKSRLLTVAQ